MGDELSEAETDFWRAWKHASEVVRDRIGEDIRAGTGLSDPDFGVLTSVVDLGGGILRQSELAASMGWHRSRLSHHLTRMEQRGLLTRRAVEGGMEVRLTTAGRTAAAEALPVHAAAVRRHLLGRLPKERAEELQTSLESLAGDRAETRPATNDG